MEEAEEGLLASMTVPREHGRQLYSTNPLERTNNKEIKRRSKVVGIFPSREATLRLAGAVLMEQQYDWQMSWRYLALR